MALPQDTPESRTGSTFDLAAVALRLWRAFQKRRRYKRDMVLLNGLSDHHMRDIGLTRDALGRWHRQDRWNGQ